MERSFLRVYNHEIETMIESGQLDEAVAHCQHILQMFPMHVETYRLLAKAFLEAKRYADAADIFQRVLMAVPDDFVSHVGMSIIRDDEGKLDEAIWHMARAFEIQPSNSAIQGELRRLYGRRDGVEPSKIRLSRDALANMYAQGELFNQAIAEIRSVLAEDPDRPDLQVMLSRAYYRSGQKVEAAEMAATLLKKYPYCMDALRVLVDVLPGTARAENSQVYRDRLQKLDPYEAFVVDSAFAADQVSDSAVDLERLEYRPGAMPGSPQPDWASSLGIKLNNENKAEPQPEWLQTPESGEPSPALMPESSEPEAVPAKGASGEAVPEWMSAAGWVPSTDTDTSQAGLADTGEALLDEPIAKADIPEWLKPMAPADGVDQVQIESGEPAESLPVGADGIPEWLKPAAPAGTVGIAADLEPKNPVEPQPVSGEKAPDWFKSVAPADATDQAQQEPEKPVEPQPAEVGDVPGWLKSTSSLVDETGQVDLTPETPAEPQPTEVGDIPDWIKSMAPADAVGLAADMEPEKPVESQPAELGDVTEWLKSTVLSDETRQAQTEPETPVEPQSVSGGDVTDWFKSVAPAEATGLPVDLQPEKPVEPQPAEAGDIPDWIKSMAPADAAGLAADLEPEKPVEPQPAEVGDVTEWFKSTAPSDKTGQAQTEPEMPVEPQPVSGGDVTDWFKSVAPEPEATRTAHAEPEKPAEPQPAEASDIPDWIKSMAPSEAAGPAADLAPEKPVEPHPASAEDVPDWFKTVASAEANELAADVQPEKPAEPQPAEASDIPDWLKSMTPTETTRAAHAEPEKPVEPQPASDEDVPEWFKSVAPAETTGTSTVVPEYSINNEVPTMESEPEPTPAEKTPSDEGALPDWLKDLGTEAASEAAAVPAKADEQPMQSAQPVLEQPVPTEPAAVLVDTQPVNMAEQIPEQPVPPEPAAQEPVTPTASASSTAGESFEPTGAVTPLDIGDDALGWLESLAAKQGAKPEELLTNADQRSSELPEYLRQPGEQPDATSVPSVQMPLRPPVKATPLESLGVFTEASESAPGQTLDETFQVKDEIPSSETPAEVQEEMPSSELPAEVVVQSVGQPVGSEADIQNWEKNLLANPESKTEESLVGLEGGQETTPDWIQKEPDEQPAVAAPEEPHPVAPELPTDDITITSWLNKMDVEEALREKSSETPGVGQPAAPAEELPDWLKDLEKPTTPIETPKADSELPDWLRSPIPSVASEPVAPIPAAELAPEPEASIWLDENVPITGGAAPTLPEEWVPAETKQVEGLEAKAPTGSNLTSETPPAVEPKPVAEPVPTAQTTPLTKPKPVAETAQVVEAVPSSLQPAFQAPTLKQTGALSHIPVKDKDAEVLSSAQTTLDQNALDDAMKQYTKLIKKGHLLDEVVHDLREATYRYPVDVIVWQTLGDAYMRSNRLQDALDAYTKAEELLR